MNQFSIEEVKENCKKFFGGDELAAGIWMKKYILRNSEGVLQESSPEDRFRTIAEEIARIDKSYGDTTYTVDDYFRLLKDRRGLPGGSGLYGIGNNFSKSSLGNCFVISGNGEDSYGSILKNDQENVQIAKRRGGVGLDLSHIRPSGFSVNNAAGSSTGVVSFMHRFSNSTREVGQEGRRGALMLSLLVNHPEVMDFLGVKEDTTKVTGANISVKATDEFMQAVVNDGYHQLRYPTDIPKVMKLDMHPNTVYKFDDGQRMNVRAREIFQELVKMNWKSAEPGILFWDKIISESPADCYPGYTSESTNPCGEIPLSPYDSCRLWSQNLTKYILNPFTNNASFNIEAFKRDSKMAFWAMDAIVDLEIEKLKEIIAKIESDPESELTKAIELNLWKEVLKTTINGRRTGISIIGHGDAVAMLGMKYGSKEANKWLVEVHKLFATYVYGASVKLAKTRGGFPAFDAELEKENAFLKRIGFAGLLRRNIALLTIPPSGSLSILMDNQSSGIEPVFMLYYERSVKAAEGDPYDYIDAVGDKWKLHKVFHPNFVKWAEANNISKEALQENPEMYIPASPYAGATSNEIDPITKVELQGAIQQYVDHSISVTHNLPEDVSLETVSNLYIRAWEVGCKGCTIYRDKSRTGVLNATGTTANKDKFEHVDAIPRPKELKCDVFHPTIDGEKYIVLVGLMDDKPYEVFALRKSEDIHIPITMKAGFCVKQKSGKYNLMSSSKELLIEDITDKFESPEWEDRTRMISMALRHRASIDYIVEQLNKSKGTVVHVSKVIARQLKKYLKKELVDTPCPECGKSMVVEGGCKQCKNCGHGACG